MKKHLDWMIYNLLNNYGLQFFKSTLLNPGTFKILAINSSRCSSIL